MKNQKQLQEEQEAQVAMALSGATDNDILKSIEEGSIDKALKNVKKAKKASIKAPLKDKPKKVKQDSHIYKEAIYGALNAKDKKTYRRKARKSRNKFIKLIPTLKGAKHKEELKAQAALFNKFYKATYKLNDLSIVSLCAMNSDQDTKEGIKSMLNVLKKMKVS